MYTDFVAGNLVLWSQLSMCIFVATKNMWKPERPPSAGWTLQARRRAAYSILRDVPHSTRPSGLGLTGFLRARCQAVRCHPRHGVDAEDRVAEGGEPGAQRGPAASAGLVGRGARAPSCRRPRLGASAASASLFSPSSLVSSSLLSSLSLRSSSLPLSMLFCDAGGGLEEGEHRRNATEARKLPGQIGRFGSTLCRLGRSVARILPRSVLAGRVEQWGSKDARLGPLAGVVFFAWPTIACDPQALQGWERVDLVC